MTKILICGDFCPIGEIESLSLNKEHEKIFGGFTKHTSDADLSIVNLECPLTDNNTPDIKFGPVLKASTKTIESLKHANFDLVTLANNHIMDHGPEGLNTTLDVCKKNGIQYVGAGSNLTEARIFHVSEIQGKKIAILNFAENEFSNTHGNSPGANPLYFPNNLKDIQKAKKENDFVLIIIHGGNENYQLPSPRLKETFRFMIDAGADAVVGHHIHCFSGYEWYNEKPIIFSVGNFIFDYNQRENKLWSTSYSIMLSVEEDKIDFEIIPFFQNYGEAGIKMMNKNEEKEVLEKVEELNQIIQDDQKLESKFQEFIAVKEKMYRHFMEPYTNKYLHGLYGRKIIPSMLNSKKKLLYLNLFRCESHRDIMFKLLDK